MGYHWYAVSPELTAITRALDDLESRMSADDDEAAVNAASHEMDVLLAREMEAGRAMAARGASVTVAAARGWPPEVQQHLAAFGASDEGRSILALLEWETNYYVENLHHEGVPMRGFSRDLRAIALEPTQVRELAQELLRHASGARKPKAAREARRAGLWLWLWASLDCRVEAGT
jgi:hypothetical protein